MEFDILFYRNRPEAYRLFLGLSEEEQCKIVKYVAPDGWTYLHQTCRDADYAFAEIMLPYMKGKLSDTVSYEHSPFYVAIQNGHVRMMELWIKNGFLLLDHQSTLYLECATRLEHLNVMKFLLNNGAKSKALFHIATYHNNPAYKNAVDVVNFLFDYGLKDNRKDNDGCTALMHYVSLISNAVRSKNMGSGRSGVAYAFSLIKIFIERGTLVWLKYPNGTTSLLSLITQIILELSYLDITLIEMILVRLRSFDLLSFTYPELDNCIDKNRYDIVYAYISHFCKVGVPLRCRDSLLLLCCACNRKEIFKLLYYAPLVSEREDGFNPYQINSVVRNITLFEILLLQYNLKMSHSDH